MDHSDNQLDRNPFVAPDELLICEQFEKTGFVIVDIDRNRFEEFSNTMLGFLETSVPNDFLPQDRTGIFDQIHDWLPEHHLNDFRLKIIGLMAENPDLRVTLYWSIAKYLWMLVGNELAMQKKLNLSIQLPGDSSSLLPIHSDVWSGDSPFEVVVWMPLVECFESKSMYICPNEIYLGRELNPLWIKSKTAEEIFKELESDLEFITINPGQVLIFNQNLPHGNIVNQEQGTRWSINCRFKSILSPYYRKNLGDFFEPITLKPASRQGFYFSEVMDIS